MKVCGIRSARLKGEAISSACRATGRGIEGHHLQRERHRLRGHRVLIADHQIICGVRSQRYGAHPLERVGYTEGFTVNRAVLAEG